MSRHSNKIRPESHWQLRQRRDRRSSTSGRAMADSRAQTKSNLNQVWAKPTRRQTEGSAGQPGDTAAPFSPALIQPIAHKVELAFLCVTIMAKGLECFLNYRCGRSPTSRHHPLQSHSNLFRCQSSWGGRSSLPYPPIIKCFWDHVGHL